MLCLDTNVVVSLLTGRQTAVRRRFDDERRTGRRLALPVIALFELRFGAANSDRPEANVRVLERLLADQIDILHFDSEDAAEAGEIRAHLRSLGTPIGPYDVLIAAQARRREATLITSNLREFQRVPGLIVMDWAA
ncbi:MAG TPA: type II toxin-antitoxin system VapC family toxin [Roseiarcus sp.]|nr:type II toxin-antitoxin system VapC family toxin [Roseiarcus sp.]